MALVINPDFPGFYYTFPGCGASTLNKLTLYLGDTISWSAFGSVASRRAKIEIYNVRTNILYTFPNKLAGSFTPPSYGCYHWSIPLNDYYHGEFISNTWIFFIINVLGTPPPPYVSPIWSKQIGPL